MSSHVVTVVSATVGEDRCDALVDGFNALLQTGLPDGLLRTELLHGPDGRWRIQSVWRDRAALDAMRAGPQEPAAPALFRRVGAEPALEIWQLVADSTASAGPGPS
jgi:quinol monooxygenase YgiN